MAYGEAWTVRRLLEWTTPYFARKQVDSPRLSAELLLAHVLNVPRIRLYTDYERILPENDLATYRALVQRGAEHEPIAYLTGRAHFFSLEFSITPDVLIPRPDTETLVENVIQFVRNQPGMEAPRILDLCTGSGCIAAALAANIKSATVVATDISEPATLIARQNLEKLNLSDRVVVARGDLFDALRDLVDPRPFNLIVANPPYIPTPQIPSLDRNVREYEPLSALDGGPDGLALCRRILQGSVDRLSPAGRMYLEIACDQGEPATQAAAAFVHLDDVRVLKDYAGRDRVITARRKP